MQSGYRKYHSTETALLRVMSDVYSAADERRVTLLALLDLSAATRSTLLSAYPIASQHRELDEQPPLEDEPRQDSATLDRNAAAAVQSRRQRSRTIDRTTRFLIKKYAEVRHDC